MISNLQLEAQTRGLVSLITDNSDLAGLSGKAVRLATALLQPRVEDPAQVQTLRSKDITQRD